VTDVSTFKPGRQLLGRALWVEHSFYNHSCAPNAYLSTTATTASTEEAATAPAAVEARLHALRPIRKGEEVTVSYIPMSGLDGGERRARLLEGYGFRCECGACCRDGGGDVRVRLPPGTDVDPIREIQHSCDQTLSQLDGDGAVEVASSSPKEGEEQVGNSSTRGEHLENCISTLRMLQRGIRNQGIPESHEVSLETHRLLAEAHSLSGQIGEALEHHRAFLDGVSVIRPIFDPVATAWQRLAYSRVLKKLRAADRKDPDSGGACAEQQLRLARSEAAAALGEDHPFVSVFIAEESESNNSRKRRRFE
jgi:hypothetical protein